MRWVRGRSVRSLVRFHGLGCVLSADVVATWLCDSRGMRVRCGLCLLGVLVVCLGAVVPAHSVRAQSVSARMVKDIRTGGEGSFPGSLTVVGGAVFFVVWEIDISDNFYGSVLWRSDGTAAGTAPVRRLFPHPWLGAVNAKGTLFFTGDDSKSGTELWKSDGTKAGTVLVKDIWPGSEGSWPDGLLSVDGTVFFFGASSERADSLWKSDGTAAGTVLVKEINRTCNSYPSRWGYPPGGGLNVGGTLFVAASDGTTGCELWKSDGTSSDTVLVKDLSPGPNDSSPRRMSEVNGTVFFAGVGQGGEGRRRYPVTELWKSDGTTAGTVLLKRIAPLWIRDVNGTAVFAGSVRGSSGRELWRSDGTTAGTHRVKDIKPGRADDLGRAPGRSINGTLFFSADDATHGYELWRSDGTAAGTRLVKDIKPGSGSSKPSNMTNVNGTLFFTARDGKHGTELWQSDGTKRGTLLVKDINRHGKSSPQELRNLNGTLLFTANDGTHGRELWKAFPAIR